MFAMFYKCNSLISLSNISKLDTSNVHDIQYIFYGCNSLRSFPDISKWKTFNVSNMKKMFTESKLKLPDFYILNMYQNNILYELIFKNDSTTIKS